ncbi:hypothetical protein PMAYCL1PPCAC_06264 [Pristionchus mayeri]|uniref:SET domain-containing protein n=1 Tax=Pristionchus mayeri TaxID=1317129 RepID=A0AAN4Z9Z4_9BILA|nr:hypothetical protein PMAYCL1PPCAC_06264 [Pristionchus mayeri]
MELGDAQFEIIFPNRYLKQENGEGKGRYITDKRALYISRLKAIEWRFNKILRVENQPKVFDWIFDWTNEEEDDESLRKLTFLLKIVKDSFVEEMLKQIEIPRVEITCDADCTACSHAIRTKSRRKCCGMQTMLDIDSEKGTIEYRDEPDLGAIGSRPFLLIECTKDCVCGEQCKNRASQKPRNFNYAIFRVPGKGWTLRALSEIDSQQHVGEYSGLVRRAKSVKKEELAYDFKMSYDIKTAKGETIPALTISAYDYGNETRFASHSCEANCDVVMSMRHRLGPWYAVPLFTSNRKILAGEEITINYFPCNDYTDVYFDCCRCGYPSCRYTEEKVKEMKESEEESDTETRKRRKKRRENQLTFVMMSQYERRKKPLRESKRTWTRTRMTNGKKQLQLKEIMLSEIRDSRMKTSKMR